MLEKSKAVRVRQFPGAHLLKVEQLKSGIGQGKNRGKAFFGGDFEVVKTTNPDAKGQTGVRWTTMKNEQWPEYFFTDIKLVLAAIGFKGGDPAKITEEIMAAAGPENAGAPQPAKGKYVGCKVYRKIKDDGKPVMECEFFKADESTDLTQYAPAEPANQDVEPARAGGSTPPGLAPSAEEDLF